MFTEVFREYELLAAKASQAFRKMEGDYGSCIKCRLHCVDCCHAVFGLFLIESVYIKHHFDQLNRRERRRALSRADQADKDLLKIEKKLQMDRNNRPVQADAIARERVRCPLLKDDGECLLYPFRPITCRVYGIPTVINGRAHVCWQAGFEQGVAYPAFDLDAAYRELFRLSKALLEGAVDQGDPERASMLLSISRSIKAAPEGFNAVAPGTL